MILGQSGRGKSSLALQLMAMGAVLVADDQTCLSVHEDHLIADAPDTIRGQIEARFVGILAALHAGPTPVQLVIDLDQVEDARLPDHRTITLLGLTRPLIRGHDAPHFAAAVHLYLTGTRLA
ncbi:MAG: HPr kinase/phosphorylase [Roseovarius sp.]